jgi:hypothetical protein
VVRHGVEQGPALRARLASNGPRPVFEVAGRQYDWSDVVAAAEDWGDWQRLEAATQEGVACVRRVEELGLELAADEVDAAAKAFRYEHKLFSADELTEWLNGWRLTSGEWLEWVRRSLLRAKWAGEVERILDEHPVEVEEVRDLLWIEGACSGVLERVARKLAGRAAAAAATGEPDTSFRALEEAFARFRSYETSDDVVEREVERQRLAWVRIDAEVVAFAGQDVAREAALCVHEGMTFDEVAAQAGVETQRISRYFDETEPELQPHLLTATQDSLVGPVEVGERFLLLHVEAKHVPTSEDAGVRRRAEQAVLRRAVEREVAQRVTWLHP